MFTFNPTQMKNFATHTYNHNRELEKRGWEPRPIIEFWGTQYVLLHGIMRIYPGRNTAEVLNIDQFDKDSHFHIFVDCQGYAWVNFEDEGWSILTEYSPDQSFADTKFHDYANPWTAVLTYDIVPPSLQSVQTTMDELDNQLQENGPRLF